MRKILISNFCLLLLIGTAHAVEIAFIGFDGDFWQVHTINEAGGNPRKLTTTPSDKTCISLDRKHRRILVHHNLAYFG